MRDAPPDSTLAGSRFFSIDNLNRMEQRNIDAYVPDSNRARALNLARAAALAPMSRPIAACSPSCEVRQLRRLTRVARQSSNRFSECSNNSVECTNLVPAG